MLVAVVLATDVHLSLAGRVVSATALSTSGPLKPSATAETDAHSLLRSLDLSSRLHNMSGGAAVADVAAASAVMLSAVMTSAASVTIFFTSSSPLLAAINLIAVSPQRVLSWPRPTRTRLGLFVGGPALGVIAGGGSLPGNRPSHALVRVRRLALRKAPAST